MDILVRTLLPRDDTPSNGSCPYEPSFSEAGAKPIFGTTTFYTFNVYFSGICAIFASLTVFLLMFLHGTHLSRPSEQIKIIKIAMIIPSYTLISWFSILVPSAYYYLDPWLEVVQSISLAAFFLLLCELVSPHEDQRTIFFAGLDKIVSQRDRKGKPAHYNTPEKKMLWYRRQWIAIFQYPPVALFCAILTDGTQAAGRFCGNSENPKYAHIWVTVIQNISVSIAVTSIFMMYQTLSMHLAHHKPLAKLVAFKLIVFLTFIQSILFLILTSTNTLKPTDTLTYADIKVGIPTLLTCLEMVPIAVYFHYSYSHRPYMIDSKRMPVPSAESKVAPQTPISSYQGGFLGYRAYLAAASPMEILEGIIFATKMASEFKKMRDSANSGSALEPLRANASSPSGHGDSLTANNYESGYDTYAPPTAPPPPHGFPQQQQQQQQQGPYSDSDNYAHGRQTSYGQSEQFARYNIYRPGRGDYDEDAYLAPPGAPPQASLQQYGTTPSPPSPPRASHSRSPSRTGELQRPGNGYYGA